MQGALTRSLLSFPCCGSRCPLHGSACTDTLPAAAQPPQLTVLELRMLSLIPNPSLQITWSVMGQPRQGLSWLYPEAQAARGFFSLNTHPSLALTDVSHHPGPSSAGLWGQGCLATSPFWGCSSHCLLCPNSPDPPSLLHGLCLIPYTPLLFFFLTEAAGSCIQRLHSPFL